MYRNFFSLSDLPFSIAPDPKYLFMSERHKEALSHLTYGQGEIGGFALLTGEVGTGKTTVSRCLMEQLPENTQAAFILNPMLSSEELLATLCDKLDIDYQQDHISLKNLTDKISEKLLENHDNGINTLLIIDEAQHLQPEVLEQLRLLTNLETNTKKLLQVILIGQPELQQLLQRRDLRQLAQRITARYHLMPLNKEELKQYIQHRLMIADCARSLFDKGAIDKIHQLSQGVPRLINLLCHSALMFAYNHNDSVVDKKIVTAAAENVLGTGVTTEKGILNSKNAFVLSTSVSVVAFIALASFWWGQSYEQPQTVSQHIPGQQVPEHQSEIKNTLNVKVGSAPIGNAQIGNTRIDNTQIDNIQIDNTQIDNAKVDSLPANLLPAEKEDVSKPSALLTEQEDTLIDQLNVQDDKGSARYARHTVKYGDSLYSISLKYNTKIKALLEWNHLSSESDISIGDKLHVIAPEGTDILVISGEKHSLTDNQNNQNNQKSKSSQNKIDDTYDIKQVDGVSDDLLARFKAAMDETEGDHISTASPDRRDSVIDRDEETIKSISELTPDQQKALPKMQFEQHIYASDGEGWITVNGRDRYEGDSINDDLIVDKILPQAVVLSFKGEKFTIPALTNW